MTKISNKIITFERHILFERPFSDQNGHFYWKNNKNTPETD